MSQKFKEFNVTVSKMLEEMKDILKENGRIMEDKKKLTKKLYNLKSHLGNIEQKIKKNLQSYCIKFC